MLVDTHPYASDSPQDFNWREGWATSTYFLKGVDVTRTPWPYSSWKKKSIKGGRFTTHTSNMSKQYKVELEDLGKLGVKVTMVGFSCLEVSTLQLQNPENGPTPWINWTNGYPTKMMDTLFNGISFQTWLILGIFSLHFHLMNFHHFRPMVQVANHIWVISRSRPFSLIPNKNTSRNDFCAMENYGN